MLGATCKNTIHLTKHNLQTTIVILYSGADTGFRLEGGGVNFIVNLPSRYK